MKIALLLCLALAAVVLLAPAQGGAHGQGAARGGSGPQCKELNQVNCYVGKNEGYFCNSKDQTRTETRWWYDKGVCRKFAYKGCNGNRNRFCTQESCERRCSRE